MMAAAISFRDLVQAHEAWVKAQGWRQTPSEPVAWRLIALGLVMTEVAEAMNECRAAEPSDKFGEELADIVLRVMGIAAHEGVDLESEIRAKMEKNMVRGPRGRVV